MILSKWHILLVLLFLLLQTPTNIVIVDGFCVQHTIKQKISEYNHHNELQQNQQRRLLMIQYERISSSSVRSSSNNNNHNVENIDEDYDDTIVDVAIVGSGLGGLCAGAILSCIYNKKVGIYESHYLPGGCAHAFQLGTTIVNSSSLSTTSTNNEIDNNEITQNDNNNNKERLLFTFDSGPTILLGCTQTRPYNPIRQVLDAINDQEVQWITYDSWGMIERRHQQHLQPSKTTTNSNVTLTEINDDDYDNTNDNFLRWKVPLGPNRFEDGPLQRFGGNIAVQEYKYLRQVTEPLLAGSAIPAMAMRTGPSAIIPLALKYFSTLIQFIQQDPTTSTTGTFAPYIDGPICTITSPWLRNWLDALAFSLSGLPANRTLAPAMAFIVHDMHKYNASLDYPVGGMGSIVSALVHAIERGSSSGNNNNDATTTTSRIPFFKNGWFPMKPSSSKSQRQTSKVYLKSHVQSIDYSTVPGENRVVGITLKNGKQITARDGVICNAPIWTLKTLITNPIAQNILNNKIPLSKQPPPQQQQQQELYQYSWIERQKTEMSSSSPSSSNWSLISSKERQDRMIQKYDTTNDNTGIHNQQKQQHEKRSLLQTCTDAEMTGSFMHLHIAINSTGIDMNAMEAHYTYMDYSIVDGYDPCSEMNMIAVSNPCKLDTRLSPPGYMVLHAYGAANEPYERWQMYKDSYNRTLYNEYKEERAKPLWRAIESIIPNVRNRTVLYRIGSPLTHERFLRRPCGTYGSATEDYLPDGSTPIPNLFLANDGIFPGIGIPAVAIAGAAAANSFVNVFQQYIVLNQLEKYDKL